MRMEICQTLLSWNLLVIEKEMSRIRFCSRLNGWRGLKVFLHVSFSDGGINGISSERTSFIFLRKVWILWNLSLAVLKLSVTSHGITYMERAKEIEDVHEKLNLIFSRIIHELCWKNWRLSLNGHSNSCGKTSNGELFVERILLKICTFPLCPYWLFYCLVNRID